MARKDWKKTGRKSNFSIDYVNEKQGDILSINNINDSPVFVELNQKEISRFKTKQKAMKFANDYMGKN